MVDWKEYFNKTLDSKPSELLVKFVKLNKNINTAIDLGCGTGKDSVYLIKNGYKVLAIDKEESVLSIIQNKLTGDEKMNIEISIQRFEDVSKLPKTDLVNANFSMSFCNPEYFNTFWQKVCYSINSNGYFVGNFLGKEDSWNQRKDMIFFDEAEINEIFKNFDIIYFNEVKKNGSTALGKEKFWHIFEIIAKNKN